MYHLAENEQKHESGMRQAADDYQFVTFQIGAECYGIDIMVVQEITRYRPPTKVFNANPTITGVVNFRGKVIPIIDMHRKFKLPDGEYDQFTVVIVVEVNGKTMGIIVDRVLDILSVGHDQLQVVENEFQEDMKTEYLESLVNQGDDLIMILAPEKLLLFEEIDNGMKGREELNEVDATT